MRYLLAIIAALFFCVPAQAQTVKALSYNTTNDTIVQTQRVIFSRLGFGVSTASAPAINYTVGTNVFGTFVNTALGIGPHLGFSVDGTRRFFISTNQIRAELPINFGTTTNAAETRTNLALGATWLTNTNAATLRSDIGLPLAALTNTSNVTTMRALAGSTNTNHPFSGTFTFTDGDGLNSYSAVVSNGIIISITEF